MEDGHTAGAGAGDKDSLDHSCTHVSMLLVDYPYKATAQGAQLHVKTSLGL